MRVDYLEGQTLGQYEIKELLGAGGMGYVYVAYQPKLKRDVAIKVLPHEFAVDSDYMERFAREAEIAASLEHPNIVPILDYGTDKGISFVVMRILTGGTLAERLKQRHTNNQSLPSLREILDLLHQLGGALDYAHLQGVIHRDIKPNNIMFDSHGNAYIVDFGIARLMHATTNLTATGTTLGTPAYMSPEQWQGEAISAAADQYSMAVVAYELLAGRPPFEADTPFALMHKHVYEEPPPLHTIAENLPAELSVVLDKALSKKPEDRYPTVTALAQSLEDASRQIMVDTRTGFFTYQVRQPTRPAQPSPTAVPDTPTRQTDDNDQGGRKRRRYLIPALLVLLVLIVGGVFFALDDSGGGDENDSNQSANAATPTLTDDQSLVSDDPTPTPTPTDAASTDTPTPPSSDTPEQATEVAFNVPQSSSGKLDVPLADDFEDASYEDSWSELTWNDNCEAVQEDGVLRITSARGNSVSCRLRNVNVSSLADIHRYEAQFFVPATEEGNNTQIALYIQDAESGNAGVICGLDARAPDGINDHFLHWVNSDHVVEEMVPSSFDVWHSFHLDYDPVTNEMTCLHDNNVVAAATLSGLDGRLNIGLELHLSNDSDTIAFVDNIRMQSITETESVDVQPTTDDLLVYDNFNNQTFDPDYDMSRWVPYGDAEGCVFGQGELVPGISQLLTFHNEKMAGESSECSLRMTQPVRLDQPLIFSADASILGDAEGRISNQGIIVRDSADTWFTYCGLDTRDSDSLNARFIMSGTATDIEVEANFFDWYNLLLSYDPETSSFRCAINGDVIGDSELPPDAPVDGEFFLILENVRSAGAPDDPAARGFMDNVLVNRHFELGMSDNFDYIEQYAEGVHPYRWKQFDLTDECVLAVVEDSLEGRGGILSMDNFREEGDPAKCAVTAAVTGSFDASFSFEGAVMVPDTLQGRTTNQALVVTTEDQEFWFYCALDTQFTDEIEARYVMLNGDEGAFPAAFEEWIRLRIDYNHEEGIMACFANDELVGEDFLPAGVDRSVPLHFVLENTRSPNGDAASGFVDEVHILK